jgi:Ca2+-binding RTX toxin-like protein
LTVVDSQVSTADANGDGTLNDLQISATVAMTNGVTITASALTGTNHITVIGTNLGGNDTITGGAGADTIAGGAGTDSLSGGAGNDIYNFGLTDGTDTITESGTGTADSIVIQASGAALSTLDFTDSSTTAATGNLVISYNGQQITVTNHFVGGNNVVETLSFSGGATYAGFSLGTGSYTISTDDSSPRASSVGVNTILSGSSAAETLTGNSGDDLIFGGGGIDTINGGNGTNLLVGDAGNDGITGGTGSDWLVGGAGNDTLTGGSGADHFVYMLTSDGSDTIADFNSAQGDTVDILVSAFGGGLTTGTDPATVFGSSATSTFGSASERFHYNTATGALLYDADGSGAGAAVTLATLTGIPTFTATNLDFI